MKYAKCPLCGSPILSDRSTVTGRDVREYDCPNCGWGEIEDRGTALWKAMSEAKDDHDDDHNDPVEA
jgi:hypothetical protein